MPAGECYRVTSAQAKEQVKEVLEHFNVKVTVSDIFSRCQVKTMMPIACKVVTTSLLFRNNLFLMKIHKNMKHNQLNKVMFYIL